MLSSYNFADYEMVRLGTKFYGFLAKSGYPGGMQKLYHCSHISAIRQFKLHLITQRLLA